MPKSLKYVSLEKIHWLLAIKSSSRGKNTEIQINISHHKLNFSLNVPSSSLVNLKHLKLETKFNTGFFTSENISGADNIGSTIWWI